jgi:hypothetical protein
VKYVQQNLPRLGLSRQRYKQQCGQALWQFKYPVSREFQTLHDELQIIEDLHFEGNFLGMSHPRLNNRYPIVYSWRQLQTLH